MKAELKRLHSPDAYDLKTFVPTSDCFCILVQAMIGPEDIDAEESFSFEFCTPKWLEENYGASTIINGMHHLIAKKYNYKLLVSTINSFLKNCEGDSWKDLAAKISHLGKWEFEGYQDV